MSKGEEKSVGRVVGVNPSLRIGPVIGRFATPTHTASARTYLNRLKKSRDLVSDKPGQFCITEVGRVAVSRDNITAQQAQQGNVTPLFPEHDDETMEIS